MLPWKLWGANKGFPGRKDTSDMCILKDSFARCEVGNLKRVQMESEKLGEYKKVSDIKESESSELVVCV